MEEIKSQLGDRMPVAMALGAKSMGLSMDKFIKKVSDGQVQSKEFIRAYATEIRSYVRETGALEASLDSVRTARSRMALTFDIGVFEGFKEAASGLKMFFTSLSELLAANFGGFKVLGEGVGFFFKTLTIGLELVSPFLFLFTRSLENVRVLFDDAFNMDKTSEQLNIFSQAIRYVGGFGLIVLGNLQMAAGKLLKAFEWLGGDSDKGVGLLANGFSLLMTAGIIGWFAKLVGQLLQLKNLFTFFGAGAAAAGAVGGVATGAAGAGAAGGVAAGAAGVGGMAGIRAKLVGKGPAAMAFLAMLTSLNWADEESKDFNATVFGDNKKFSEMLGDAFSSFGEYYKDNTSKYANLVSGQAVNINITKQEGIDVEVNSLTDKDAMKAL